MGKQKLRHVCVLCRARAKGANQTFQRKWSDRQRRKTVKTFPFLTAFGVFPRFKGNKSI